MTPCRGSCAALRTAALLLVLPLVVSGCTLAATNFSQYPGFAAYLAAHPRAQQPPDARERTLLEAFRPRFFVAAHERGPISFYADYIAAGTLRDGDGKHVSSTVDRDLLNAHADDPRATFVHTGPDAGGTAVVPARVRTAELDLPGMEAPQRALFLAYNLVFRQSGLAAGLAGWQRGLIDLVADADDWHQLDHYAAVTLVLVAERGADVAAAGADELIPVAAIMQQHNYRRTYVIVDDPARAAHPGRVALGAERRIGVDVARHSHALFPHAPQRRRHRAVRFLDADTAHYLITGEDSPWLAGDDITDPAREVDYELAFLPPTDAFYMFEGFLGERRRLPGRDSPPGAFYNTLPPLKPDAVQLAAFFWHEDAEGFAADWRALDLAGAELPSPAALAPFERGLVRALPCREDWRLPCGRTAVRGARTP